MAIGASTTISLYILPPVLSAYLQLHPTAQLTLKNRNSENIVKALLEHEIDLGIVEGVNKLSNVTYTPFMTDEVIAVCSSKNPLKNHKLNLKDLYQVPLALRELGSGTLAVLTESLLLHQVKLYELPVKIRLGGTEALKNFVRVDNCLAFLPRQAVLKVEQSNPCRKSLIIPSFGSTSLKKPLHNKWRSFFGSIIYPLQLVLTNFLRI